MGSGANRPGPAHHLESARAEGGRSNRRPAGQWADRESEITSAIEPRRAMASSVEMAIGSSVKLPLVQTIGRPTAARSK